MRLPASYWITEMAGAVDSGNGEFYVWESVAGTKMTVVTSMVWGWCFRAHALDSHWGFDSLPVL